jgi:hypothetical protein
MTNPGLKTDLQGEVPAPNSLSQGSAVDRLVFTTCTVRSGPLDIIAANFHRGFSEYFLFPCPYHSTIVPYSPSFTRYYYQKDKPTKSGIFHKATIFLKLDNIGQKSTFTFLVFKVLT